MRHKSMQESIQVSPARGVSKHKCSVSHASRCICYIDGTAVSRDARETHHVLRKNPMFRPVLWSRKQEGHADVIVSNGDAIQRYRCPVFERQQTNLTILPCERPTQSSASPSSTSVLLTRILHKESDDAANCFILLCRIHRVLPWCPNCCWALVATPDIRYKYKPKAPRTCRNVACHSCERYFQHVGSKWPD